MSEEYRTISDEIEGLTKILLREVPGLAKVTAKITNTGKVYLREATIGNLYYSSSMTQNFTDEDLEKKAKSAPKRSISSVSRRSGALKYDMKSIIPTGKIDSFSLRNGIKIAKENILPRVDVIFRPEYSPKYYYHQQTKNPAEILERKIRTALNTEIVALILMKKEAANIIDFLAATDKMSGDRSNVIRKENETSFHLSYIKDENKKEMTRDLKLVRRSTTDPANFSLKLDSDHISLYEGPLSAQIELPRKLLQK